jgi:endonuclease
MRADYKAALGAAGYQDNTIAAQMHRVGKVEQFYGSLDEIVSSGGYEALIADLTYSTADERAGKPNPSRILFEGNIRNNLQSYKNAVARYVQFLRAEGEGTLANDPVTKPVLVASDGPEKQRLSLERDMQHALRKNISLLENGLSIIDDGIERSVLSGFIDILCRDTEGLLVVIELKAGKTDARVIGQVLGYMGDLQEEEETEVRGIIVAHDFDQRTRSAAKAVPSLALFRYAVSFQFDREV